jgi:hypothetical protein
MIASSRRPENRTARRTEGGDVILIAMIRA